MGAFNQRCHAIDLPWQPWPQALKTAATHERPVFLFIGQALDAWSWRMADDLAGDEELLALIAAGFVPCAIESVAEPAAAALCQQVLAMSAGASGWPAVCFLLADGTPLGAVPWSPMRDRDRRAGLATVCVQLLEQWQQDPESLCRWGARLLDDLAPLRCLPTAPMRGDDLLLPAAEAAALEAADTLEGGFGSAPRHLGLAPLHFLCTRAGESGASDALRTHLLRSVDALIGGACHDHLGGGFHRASQDAGWNLPFFEKRCGDQAQMAMLLDETAALTGVAIYRALAERTLGWAHAALGQEDGSWCHGLHACCNGPQGAAEGATYAWSEPGAAAIVGSEGAHLFASRYLTGPELPGGFRVPAPRGDCTQAELDRLPTLCARLAQARAERPAPWRDDTVYPHEQGMALTACCRFAALAPWNERAQALATWLLNASDHLNASGDFRALAWAASGLWAWHRISGDTSAAACARSWAAALWTARRTDSTLPTAAGPHPGAWLPAVLDDDTGPSTAAVARSLFAELGQDDDTWNQRAQAYHDAHRPLLALSPMPAIGLLADIH